VEKYLEWYDNDGLQMSVRGKAYLNKGWSENGFRSIEKSGRPAKMVIDPGEEEKGASQVSCDFWDKDEEKLWALPVHPVLDCFDLEEHADYRVHVNNSEVYIYDTKVGDKLVLPEDVKSFIEVLIEHSKNKFVDIVGGKEGGTIILLEGPPGTGKTLTAEVYSEVMERSLYKVQSSQLGTDPQSVEAQLKIVFQRAERWSAILLIDESDVYIHARGDDIDQNAIVGVFLRVLEYYRGVLFMTTNRGTLVDDAIISRLTARFRYTAPSKEDQTQLWRILADQNAIKLSDIEIGKIVKGTPNLSGRDIKNLLKLAFVAEIKSGKPITAETVARVSKFRQMPE
jgi:SpoVK/Ycf46/Vps4 family AAA+-type ATPase